VIYRRLVRPALFRLDAERVHDLALRALSAAGTGLQVAGPLLPRPDPRLEQRVLGLTFPVPIGLAAGFDKDARAVPAWAALGFGFAEVGTLTARPQSGNPRPRMFRLPEDEALLNRLGFNNRGAAEAAARLDRLGRRGPRRIPLGVNIGKSAAVPLEYAAEDYLRAYDRVWPHADYVVVNVSSPNTPGLRRLQGRERLEEVLRAILGHPQRRPLLVKVDPDLPPGALDEVVDLAVEIGLDGLVVSNTTLSREGLTSPRASEAGGVSGLPVRDRSTEAIRQVARRAPGLTVIGVGGVRSAKDAWEKLRAGASLIQLYTGLVYEGPGVARRIARGLVRRLEYAELGSIGEVVGQAPGVRGA
jgi:dihydroorotate dehydrogenase